MDLDVFTNFGKVNTHSTLAGIDVTKLSKLRSQQVKDCFRHLEEQLYKQEYVATIHDTEFINDAASVTVNSTWYALESIEGPLVWIALGNENTAETYTKLERLAAQKVKMLLCIGDNTSALHEAFDGIVPVIEDVKTIQEAVHRAFYNQLERKKVLFSPAAVSQESVAEMGACFNKEVNEI